jgi:hypothetical protein
MAADEEASQQRATDPIVTGIGEAVAHGYRAVDHVYAGLAQSARLMGASRTTRAAAARRAPAAAALDDAGLQAGAGAPPQRPSSASPTLVGELAGITADVLDRLGEAARDIAGRIGEAPVADPGPAVGRLALSAHPGRTALTEFRFTNTGSTTLQGIECDGTPLIGVAGRIDEIAFDYDFPPDGLRLRPRVSTSVGVRVPIGEDVAPGVYRGVVMARAAAPGGSGAAEAQPVGAWALLELEVLTRDVR